jgi:glutathione S-transferase
MTELVLHSYDASPFTQRVLRMLGFKGLEWGWVETPMMPPKPDLVALTGGYRGTPVLQIGRDIYIDSQLIALELERRFPHPSLFPGRNMGVALALDAWSDMFFRSGLNIVLAVSAGTWPEPFRRDREYLFGDIDFSAVASELDHARSQFRAHASLLERQLGDGRAFLEGARPGLLDANAHPFIWLMRGAQPGIAAELLANVPLLCAWEARVAEHGEGSRVPMDAARSLTLLSDAPAIEAPQIDAHDAQGLAAGARVRISPTATRRGDVEGIVHAAAANEIAVLRDHPQGGAVLVHFPRLGYRVTRLD